MLWVLGSGELSAKIQINGLRLKWPQSWATINIEAKKLLPIVESAAV